MYKRSYSSTTCSLIKRAASSSTRKPGCSPVVTQSQPLNQYRSYSFLRSVPRWSHGVDWKSPASLTSQIRSSSPLLERLQRSFATMGTFSPSYRFFVCNCVASCTFLSIFELMLSYCFSLEIHIMICGSETVENYNSDLLIVYSVICCDLCYVLR